MMQQAQQHRLFAQAAFHIERNPAQSNSNVLSDKSFVENLFFDCSIFNVDGSVCGFCKGGIMSYHNNSSSVLLRKNAEKVKDIVSSLCVQIASRLVCKNYCGVIH